MRELKSLFIDLGKIWPDLPEPIQAAILDRLNRLMKPKYLRCPFGRVPRYKRYVLVSTTCPQCREDDAVEVRSGGGFYCRFWYCSKGCGWACWRPPSFYPCLNCLGPTIWSASRLSVACFDCGNRQRI